MGKDLHPIRQRRAFTISSVKATKLPTYTIKDALGEPVSGDLLRTRAAVECTGKLPYRTSTQEEEKPSVSVCQVEMLQWRVSFVGTIN